MTHNYMLGVDLIKYPGKRKRNRGFDIFRKRYLSISGEVYKTESDFEGITDRKKFLSSPKLTIRNSFWNYFRTISMKRGEKIWKI